MAQNFLHGVETIQIDKGTVSVQEVKTAIIGLIGIAPKGPRNKCTLIKRDSEISIFGSQLPGFDIPQSLTHIFEQGAGAVIVVNVFDETLHTISATDEEKTITNGKLRLSAAPIGNITIKKQDGSNAPYLIGTDFTINEFGELRVVSGRIPESTILKFSYKKLNPSAVTIDHIKGEIDISGSRSGMKVWDLSFTLFGFHPKILIAPGRSNTKAIANELAVYAEKMKAVSLIDGPYGADVTTVLSNRGNPATAFGTSNKRLILLYPFLKSYDQSKEVDDPEVDTNTDFPYSPYFAGIMAKTDKELGYWFSPSNKEIQGITGIERPISSSLTDGNTDANYLNEKGITTIFNTYGTGYRTWGNRNASFPASGYIDTFIPILRTFDVVHESLELAALNFIDLPITQGIINSIKQSGNSFINILVGRGALVPGSKVIYDTNDNPAEQLANGKIVFRILKMGTPPAELISYLSIVDMNLLKNSIK